MKTAGRETPNSRARLCHEPSTWGGRPKPFLLNHTGWRSRKRPVEGRVFFLTSPFIELLGTWPSNSPCQTRRGSISPQIAYPPIKNSLIVLFKFSESDTHSVCASGGHTAGGHDFRACIDHGDLHLHPEIQGSWGRHKAAMHAHIAGMG